jgi:hypothetical protein
MTFTWPKKGRGWNDSDQVAIELEDRQLHTFSAMRVSTPRALKYPTNPVTDRDHNKQ